MLRAVLDTNVVVAALRSKTGASAAILAAVGTGTFELIMSVALALEYEEVLKREVPYVPRAELDELVSFLCVNARRQETGSSAWPLVADPDDELLARLAVASACDYLVTHNVRDVRGVESLGTTVITPSRFIRIMRGRP